MHVMADVDDFFVLRFSQSRLVVFCSRFIIMSCLTIIVLLLFLTLCTVLYCLYCTALSSESTDCTYQTVIYGAEHYSRGHQLLDHSIVSQHFMEPKGSIQNSQALSTCSFPENALSRPYDKQNTKNSE
jgi:hypothetical protein